MSIEKPTIEGLSSKNFFAVLDMATEIQEILETTSDEEIRLTVLKAVMQYRDERQKESLNRRRTAMNFLNEVGCFSRFLIRDLVTPYKAEFFIVKVNRPVFQTTYKALLEKEKHDQKTPKVDAEGNPVGEFIFDNGVLFHTGKKKALPFSEKSLEYQILITAFNKPPGERIDNATYPLDCGWRALYDAADRINKKVEKHFGVGDFFFIDFKGKFIKRSP